MAQAVTPPPAEPSSLRLRAAAVLVVVACLFAALFGRLWFLQGVEAGTPAVAQVATQGVVTVYLPAPRGEIFDRDGVLLAGNRIEQVVSVLPGAQEAHPGIVEELSALLGEPVARVKAAIDSVQYSPYQPVPVAQGVSTATVLAIDENQSLLPGVVVQAQPVRYYPYGDTTANILGYVSQITGAEYAGDKDDKCGAGVDCYGTGSMIGQAGVEESFENYLRGRPGVEKVQVDSQGHVLNSYMVSPPVPGDNLVLSISLTDQQAAVQALDDWVVKARGVWDKVSNHDFRAPAPRWWSKTRATGRYSRWPRTPTTTRRTSSEASARPSGRTTTTRPTTTPSSTGPLARVTLPGRPGSSLPPRPCSAMACVRPTPCTTTEAVTRSAGRFSTTTTTPSWATSTWPRP